MAKAAALAFGVVALLSSASAVPTSQLALQQVVEVTPSFAGASHKAAEAAVEGILAQATGARVIANVVHEDNPTRRLQEGTTLTIDYAIVCGSSCEEGNARLNEIATNPAAGEAHATAIIAAINAAAANAGFGPNVVVSSAAEVMATIQAPTGDGHHPCSALRCKVVQIEHSV